MDENTPVNQQDSNNNKVNNKNSMYAPLIALAALLILGGAAFALVSTNNTKTNQMALTATPNSTNRINNTETDITPTEIVVPTMEEIIPTVNTPISTLTPTTSFSPSATNTVSPTSKTFTVSGSNYKFDVSTITVNKGDNVTIKFMNKEGFHDWVLDEFNAKTKQIQGVGEDTISFVADKAGTFEYYCSVGQHRQMGMKGTLIVK